MGIAQEVQILRFTSIKTVSRVILSDCRQSPHVKVWTFLVR